MSLRRILIFLFAVLSFSHAQAQGLDADTLDLKRVLLETVMNPRTYSGYKGKIQQLPSNWSCDDRRYFWSLNWKASLDDVQVHYDPAAPDFTQVRIILKNSSLRAMYYKRDGVFCLWSGGEGEIRTGRIEVGFSLRAVANDAAPELSLNELFIRDFGMSDVGVMYRTFFTTGFREASNGFADFVERNFNGIVKSLLNSSLKKHINAAINRELEKRLKEREKEGPIVRP
jgi:hypothetical protein